jgi:urea transport system permease protein
VPQSVVSVWFFWASALALGLGYLVAAWVVSGKFGNVIAGIRDDEARVRFLGYPVEAYKLVVFTLTAMICGNCRARSTIRRRASSIRTRSPRSRRSTWRSGSPSAGAGGSMARSSARRWCRFCRPGSPGAGADMDLGFYTDQLGRLVAGAAGPRLRAGDAFRAKGIGGLFDRLVRKDAA